jgi:hypothetical protein
MNQLVAIAAQRNQVTHFGSFPLDSVNQMMCVVAEIPNSTQPAFGIVSDKALASYQFPLLGF